MRLLARPSIAYSLAAVVSSGVNFLAILLWTRILSPTEYGQLALVSGIALTLNAFLFESLRLSGMRLGIDKEAPDGVSPHRIQTVASFYGLFIALLWLMLGGLQAAGIEMLGIRAEWWILIAAYATFEGLLNLTTSMSRMRIRPQAFFFATVLRAFLAVGIGVAMVQADFGMAGVVAGIVIGQSLVFLGTLMLDRWWRQVKPWQPDKEMAQAVIHYGLPLVAVQGLQYFVNVSDRFFIEHFLGTEATGHYAVVSDLLQKTLIFIMLLINMITLPDIMRGHEAEGEEKSRRMLGNNLLLQCGLGFPAAAGLAMLAPGTANLLLGAEFREPAILLLPWLAAAMLARCMMSFYFSVVFLLIKQTRKMILPILLILLLQAPASWLVIPQWGLEGAGAVALGSSLAGLLVSCLMARKSYRLFWPWKDLAKLALATLVMAAALWFLRGYATPLTYLASVAAGGTLYGVMLLALNPAGIRQKIATRL
jgi:O-antigen/teichoic acid export membrane protein